MNVSGASKYYADKDNRFENAGYAVFGAKFGYEKDNFEGYFWSSNLTNKKHDVIGHAGRVRAISAPREFGLNLAYRF